MTGNSLLLFQSAGNMIPEERRNRILTKLTEKGVYSVNELGDILRVVFRRAEETSGTHRISSSRIWSDRGV